VLGVIGNDALARKQPLERAAHSLDEIQSLVDQSLLTVLDGFLLPPQPATTNEFDQTATPHTRVRDVGVGPA
jgi:hypothetical protein